MRKIGIMLLGVGALVGLNGIALAQESTDRNATTQTISDRDLFGAASMATVLSLESVTVVDQSASLVQGATRLALGGELEGPEGPDLDGPGGSTHEFEGEGTGDD